MSKKQVPVKFSDTLDEGIFDVMRGAAGLAKQGLSKLNQQGKQAANVHQFQTEIARSTKQLAGIANDRVRASFIAQRLVDAADKLNQLGQNGTEMLKRELLSYAKTADVNAMNARIGDAMRYLGVSFKQAQQQQAQQQAPVPQGAPNAGGVAPAFQAPKQAPAPQQAPVAPQQTQQTQQAPAPQQQAQEPQAVPAPQAFRTNKKDARMVPGKHGPEFKFGESFINELFMLDEAKKPKVGKKTAAKVYHRDYEKTKNKPYRQYDPTEYKADKKKRKVVKEEIGAHELMGLSKFLTHHSDHDADRSLRHDLHLLRLISRETSPKETDVSSEDGRKVVRFFYPVKDMKGSKVFDKFKMMFGEPRGRSHHNGLIQAHFKDRLTGVDIVLQYNPAEGYLTASFPLKSHLDPHLGEYYVNQIKNVCKFLTEGKMKSEDIFFLLVETPGIGHPYGGAAGPDQANGTADLRKDVSGISDQIMWIRSALARHLKADDHDWVYFSNAPTIDEAAKRLEQIINKLPQVQTASPAAVHQAAEQVARVYWGQEVK